MKFFTNKIEQIANPKIRVGIQRTLTSFIILLVASLLIALIAISNKAIFNSLSTNSYLWVEVSHGTKVITMLLFMVIIGFLSYFTTMETYKIINQNQFQKLKSKHFWMLLCSNWLVYLILMSYIAGVIYQPGLIQLTKPFFFNLFFILLVLFFVYYGWLLFYLKTINLNLLRRQRSIFITINLLSLIFWIALFYVGIINSWMVVFLLLMLASLNDTYSYLFGTIWGKRNIFKKISPNKTLEGFIGGIGGSLITTYIFLILFGWLGLNHLDQLNSNINQVLDAFWFTQYTSGNLFLQKSAGWWILAIFIILFLILTGTAGDLFFSKMKRYLDIKDYSKLLGKHGGLYDRLDSLIFVFAFYFLANMINGMIFF